MALSLAQGIREHLQTLESKRQRDLDRQLKWERKLCEKEIQDFSINDVKKLCARQGIVVDEDRLDENKADGRRLSKITSVTMVMKLLGCEPFGDATFMFMTLQSLRSAHVLIPPRNGSLTAPNAPERTGVRGWSVKKTYDWLVSAGLAEAKPIFKRHRIGGDVLLNIDLAVFAELDLTLLDHLEELTAAIAKLKQSVRLLSHAQYCLS